jgi:hypothetical protein
MDQISNILNSELWPLQLRRQDGNMAPAPLRVLFAALVRFRDLRHFFSAEEWKEWKDRVFFKCAKNGLPSDSCLQLCTTDIHNVLKCFARFSASPPLCTSILPTFVCRAVNDDNWCRYQTQTIFLVDCKNFPSRDSVTRFLPRFFHQSTHPRALIPRLKPFRVLLQIFRWVVGFRGLNEYMEAASVISMRPHKRIWRFHWDHRSSFRGFNETAEAAPVVSMRPHLKKKHNFS